MPVFALCSSWCFSGWVDPDVITQTARETISLELSRDQVIRAIRLPNGAWSGSLGSTAAVLVFPLIAFGLCILAHTEKPHKNKILASSQLEQRGVQWGCALLTGSVLTGMIWANFSWGGAAFPDPRLFAGITAILLLLAWHVADAEFGPESTAPSWLALTAFLVMLWATLGPSLGWTAPTLHNFGP